MQINFKELNNCPLFNGNTEEETKRICDCLDARSIRVIKNQIVFLEGAPATSVGIVLSGSVQIIREDYYGNRSIVGMAEPYGLFGEVFACAGLQKLPVSVIACEDSEIILLNCKHIMTTCAKSCEFHNRIIFNLLHILASKNLLLSQKIEITGRHTTKEKLMAYLLAQAKQHNSRSFTIPYDRHSLADYLGVERSAMSTELGKLRDEGKILYHKNYFTLISDSTF